MSIDKTTLNRIRIAIQHALCSCVEDNDDDVHYESMAKAAVDLGIIEKEEDFDEETFTHAPILFEKIWERIGDDLYKTPLDLFNAWLEDDMSIYRLGEEIEDWSEVQLACSMMQVILSGRNPIANFVFVGKDFVKLYKDRSVQDLNDMQREAFELMRDYIVRKEAGHLGLKMAARLFGRKKDEDEEFTTKKGRKFIRMYDPETGEYLGPLVKPMTHEEAHGKKEPINDIKVDFNKEAWDKLKIDILGIKMSDKEVLEMTNAAHNSAEIFCRATDGSYKDFEQYAAEFGSMSPMESLNLPYVVDESIRKLNSIAELSEIELNVSLLVYSVYSSRYKPTKYSYGAIDVIFDIVNSMLELKEEGMIQ